MQAQGTEATFFFPCEAWLDATHGAQRVLVPAKADPRIQMQAYIVSLYTGKEDGAGTSAHVAITAHGEKRSSGPHAVKASPGLEKPLQPGQVVMVSG